MKRYMLDTNTASYIIKGKPPEVRIHLASLPVESICISAITKAELLYGVARKGNPPNLMNVVQQFLLRVETLPWDAEVASVYGDLRLRCEGAGITLSAHDMMIAAHAVTEEVTLVSHDKIFSLVPDGVLLVEDWVL